MILFFMDPTVGANGCSPNQGACNALLQQAFEKLTAGIISTAKLYI